MSIFGLFACFPFLNNNAIFVIVEMEVSNLISLFPVTDIRIMARTFLFLAILRTGRNSLYHYINSLKFYTVSFYCIPKLSTIKAC